MRNPPLSTGYYPVFLCPLCTPWVSG